ncbi:5'-hydroxyaverantin dehydrogenase [Cladophialophora carrionii]|uniref:5'-hydroxyaverantin dehydrogenase n=1 Tax=Cladophialophora carrionii TaxID=86049 RepID=A0A1C1CIE9_9EURO|nr:5'-hydroxyaverantin dehydrogenase [Cladophialophora carrionii]
MTSILAPADFAGLRGRSILVTGGASGLGLETVQLLASNGAYVTIADIQPPLDNLTREDQHVQYVHCDVSDWASQVAAFKAAIQFSPTRSLDAVATFAAVDPLENLIDQVKAVKDVSLDIDPAPPSLRTIDINLRGSYYSATLALHYFRLEPQSPASSNPQTKGLVFVSSLAGYLDDDHNIAYTTSKFGTRGLFRALRRRTNADFSPGVRVNLIAPWAIRTPMTEPLLKVMEESAGPVQGITFAKKETCAEAVGTCVVDESIHGRAFAIMPEGVFDIKDDITGGYGGEELKVLMSWRKAAGDFLQG